ncbi:hypothetical protein [Halolactibacillus sp. JCM 19043]|nr:hypothetical protein [Halolactibacillus sp. JCM 19043]
MAHFVEDKEKLIHMLNIMILKGDKKIKRRKTEKQLYELKFL